MLLIIKRDKEKNLWLMLNEIFRLLSIEHKKLTINIKTLPQSKSQRLVR